MKYILTDMYTLKIEKELEGDFERVAKEKNYAYGINESPLRWYKESKFKELCDLQNNKNSVE